MSQPARRDSQSGLTLVEVLVALMLFSMIGLAGFTMLDNILNVRAGTEERLERLARIDRALVLFSRDLQQSDPDTLIKDGDTLSMVRVGTGGLSYLERGGSLVRRLSPDGFDQRLIEDVRGLEFRAFDSDGVWHDIWPLERTRPLGLPPALAAIEMRLELGEGSIRRLVDLPTGSRK